MLARHFDHLARRQRIGVQSTGIPGRQPDRIDHRDLGLWTQRARRSMIEVDAFHGAFARCPRWTTLANTSALFGVAGGCEPYGWPKRDHRGRPALATGLAVVPTAVGFGILCGVRWLTTRLALPRRSGPFPGDRGSLGCPTPGQAPPPRRPNADRSRCHRCAHARRRP